MATSVTAIADVFSPTSATATAPSGTATAGATVTSGGGSFVSYSSSGTTGGATATTSTGSSTTTLTCANCCSCGGHLLSLFGPTGYCPGLADTAAPIELTVTFVSTPRPAFSYLGTKTVSVKGTSNLPWPSYLVGNCNFYTAITLTNGLGYSPTFFYPGFGGDYLSFTSDNPPKAHLIRSYQSSISASGLTWFGLQAPFYTGGGLNGDWIELSFGWNLTSAGYLVNPLSPATHSCSPFSLTYSGGEIYYVQRRYVLGGATFTKGTVIADVTATATF